MPTNLIIVKGIYFFNRVADLILTLAIWLITGEILDTTNPRYVLILTSCFLENLMPALWFFKSVYAPYWLKVDYVYIGHSLSQIY